MQEGPPRLSGATPLVLDDCEILLDQYSPSSRRTTIITTIAPMMYRIEYMLVSLLSGYRYSGWLFRSGRPVNGSVEAE